MERNGMLEFIIFLAFIHWLVGDKIFQEFTFYRWLLLNLLIPVYWNVGQWLGKILFWCPIRTSFLFHFTDSIYTVLSLMFLHPSFSHKPSIDMTSNTVTNDWFAPHEYNTEETCQDGWIHRCNDKCSIFYIILCDLEHSHNCFHLYSLRWCDKFPEQEHTVNGKCREKYSDTPCKSLLDCPNPYFFTFWEE